MENFSPQERSPERRQDIKKVTFTFKDGSTREFGSFAEARAAAQEDNENQ